MTSITSSTTMQMQPTGQIAWGFARCSGILLGGVSRPKRGRPMFDGCNALQCVADSGRDLSVGRPQYVVGGVSGNHSFLS